MLDKSNASQRNIEDSYNFSYLGLLREQRFIYSFMIAILFFIIFFISNTIVSAQATLPADFIETQVASGISSPTSMAIAPDGRIFITQQSGTVRIVENDILLPTPFLTVTTDDFFERGLLGLAFDPNFASNNFVYVYYTATTPTTHNRVSRFTANGNVVVPGSELILMELEDLGAGNHNGGAMHFGPDNRLYIGTGDNAISSNSQLLTNRLGKILRINSDGSIPTNPLSASTTGVNRAIWAYGLRNPYNFAFDPVSGRMHINDVGQNTWEEINLGIAGANYGWPTTEGETTNPNFESPLLAYPHGVSGNNDDGCAIVGAAFYRGSQFPAEYVGDYFYADYCNDWIRHYDINTDTSTLFTPNPTGSIVDIRVGDDGALYYLARDGGGQLFRIEYSTAVAPTITLNPTDDTVAEGDPVTFSCNASGSAPLTFQWQQDNVNIPGATGTDYTIPSTAFADDGAVFRCIATNSAGNATSTGATLTVIQGAPPTGVITSPISGTDYNGGDVFAFDGTGSDPEDGTLPASAFTWWVDFHHDTHTHPFMPPTTGITNGTFTIPIDGHTETNVWYRVYLQVTDSSGLTHESYVEIFPNLVQFTVETAPTGLDVTIDGQPQTAPVTIDSVVGIQRNLVALSPQQNISGTTLYFESWSDGGNASHNITAPATNTTYTATYTVDVPRNSSSNQNEADETLLGSNETNSPSLLIGDPAISKIGFLLPGQVGVTGEKLEWIITVRNNGSVPVNNVRVSDTLVDALKVDRVDTPKGTVNINGQTVTVSLGTLQPNEVVQFSIFTTVLDGVTVNNTACIEADNADKQCVTAPVITQLPKTGEAPRWSIYLRVIIAILSVGIVSVGAMKLAQKRNKIHSKIKGSVINTEI